MVIHRIVFCVAGAVAITAVLTAPYLFFVKDDPITAVLCLMITKVATEVGKMAKTRIQAGGVE